VPWWKKSYRDDPSREWRKIRVRRVPVSSNDEQSLPPCRSRRKPLKDRDLVSFDLDRAWHESIGMNFRPIAIRAIISVRGLRTALISIEEFYMEEWNSGVETFQGFNNSSEDFTKKMNE